MSVAEEEREERFLDGSEEVTWTTPRNITLPDDADIATLRLTSSGHIKIGRENHHEDVDRIVTPGFRIMVYQNAKTRLYIQKKLLNRKGIL